MEPSAPIIIVDGGVGGLCRRQSSLTEAAVGGADGAEHCH